MNWTALEKAGIHKDTRVTLQAKDEKFSKVLDSILHAADGANKLNYVVEDEVIIISTVRNPSTKPATQN